MMDLCSFNSVLWPFILDTEQEGNLVDLVDAYNALAQTEWPVTILKNI